MFVVAFFAEACARRKEATANDPPADDFGSATRIGFRHLDPDEVARDPELVRGVDALGARAEAAVDFARHLRVEDASAGAMLRAFERATGSVRYGGEQFTDRRLSEAQRYARADADALDAVALAATQYAPILAVGPGADEGPVDAGARSDARSAASRDARRLLERHRAAEPELDAILEVPRDPADLRVELLEGAPTVEGDAFTLRAWEPGADLQRLREL